MRLLVFVIVAIIVPNITYAAICPFKTLVPPNCTATPFPLSACGENEQFVPILDTGVCRPCDVAVPESRPGYICQGGKIKLCPAGHVCPYNATAKTYNRAIRCQEGTLCMSGFTKPLECSIFAQCPVGATTREPVQSSFVVSALILVFGILLSCFLKSKKKKKLEASATLRDTFKAVRGEQLGAGLPLRNSPVVLQFKNVSMKLKSNGAEIVKGVSGYFPPGSLVALMGPSGAGKTSFMNAILGRAPYANVSGTISVNGIKNGLLNARNSVGFVPQDDICHTDLTVYQNLYYNALLRLPSNISKNEKKKHVQTIINALGLSHIQNHVVGSPSKRGISGGQKKRVNIGMELVAMPSIMFMDEPTSGLDGTATLELAQCLLKLKETGLTIVCVIHQPRYAVFKSFTHTLLLGAGGQQVYGGRTKNIMNYFYEQRFRLPLNENPADWIIDIASGFSPKYNSMDESDESIVEKFEAPIDLFKWWATWYAADCYQPEARWNSCPTISNKPETAKIEPLQNRNTPNTCMQTFLFCQRIIEQHDNTKFMVTNIALWMASFLLSSIRSGTEYRYGTLYAVLPGAVSILAMVCALQSHALIYSETLQYYRELKNGMSATGFFLAKFGYDICCTFVYACFWALACYTINPPIQRLASAYLFTYIGFAFYWASLGSLIAVIFPNSHTTGLLIMVFMPALERLWSGTEAENMGGVPIRDFVGFKQMFSFLSSGRWVSQSLYCGELLALPSHTRDFQGIPEKLYNISVVDTTIDSITDAELNVCMSNAVGTLFLLGAIFRLLTWGCFMLTKFSEGLTRRSQIYYICKRYLKVYCFDENVCSCCFEKEQEDVNTGTPFDHTNLNAIFKPSRPTGSGTDNANALETVETKISIKLCGNGSKKNQVIPSD